jgi:(p)ppGpp synthase/HD superfamily hydrolase
LTNHLEKAIAVALEAHAGVVTRSGRPYILHPLRLMIQMESEEEMITAVLHDVVEDSTITLDDLAAMGFVKEILDALALLTHDKETTRYEDYITGIKANPLALKIKLADLEHNMDIRRLPNKMSRSDLERLQKYRHAWKILTGL